MINCSKVFIAVLVVLSCFSYAKTPPQEPVLTTGCISGDCNNGQGTMTFADGRKYVGEWKDGKPNGQGTETFANGTNYVGKWKDGKQYNRGRGTIIFADGRKYVGELKDGKEDGLWTRWNENGQMESEGTYKDGVGLDGLETYWYINGEKKEELTYKNGKLIESKCWDEDGNKEECD